MANVIMLWDGEAGTPGLYTTDYSQGPTSGYINSSVLNESWAGSNLTYASVLLTGNVYPISGTLTSWQTLRSDGALSLVISDLNYSIPRGATYNTIVAGLLDGKDNWYGDSADNFFYVSGGGDTYNGFAGVDTVDAFVEKDFWFHSATSINRVGDVVTVENFGTTSLVLNSVERIRFSDVSLAFDLEGNAGKVVKILGAVFGAEYVSDREYVGIGLYFLDKQEDHLAVIDLALHARLGANYGTSDLVQVLYQNVTGTPASQLELEVFGSMISSGQIKPRDLAWLAADTSLNIDNIDLVGLSQTGVEYTPFG